jgi:hypothetical protein
VDPNASPELQAQQQAAQLQRQSIPAAQQALERLARELQLEWLAA